MNGFDRARAERAAEAEREAQAVEALARKLRWFRGVSAVALAGGVDGERPSAAVGVTLEHVRRRLQLLAAEGRAVELGGLWYEPGRVPAPVLDPGRPLEVTHFEPQRSEPPPELAAPAVSELPTPQPIAPEEVPMPKPVDPEPVPELRVPELRVPETREAAAPPKAPPRDPSTWTHTELRAELVRALADGPFTIRQLVEQLRPGTEGKELHNWCDRVRHALVKDPVFVQGDRVGREGNLWRLDRRRRPRREEPAPVPESDASSAVAPTPEAPPRGAGLGGPGTLADIRDVLDRHHVLAAASSPDGEYQDISLTDRVELLARSQDLQNDRVRALQNEKEGWRTFFAALWVEAGLGLPDRTHANPDPYDHRGPSGDDLLELVSAGAKALARLGKQGTEPQWVSLEQYTHLRVLDGVVVAVLEDFGEGNGARYIVVDDAAPELPKEDQLLDTVTLERGWYGVAPNVGLAKAVVDALLRSIRPEPARKAS